MTEKQKIISKFKIHKDDKGSTQVQVALLTSDIIKLTEHMKENKKDFSNKRQLITKVNQRNKLLKYLKNRNEDEYLKLIQELNLRK